MKVVIRPKLKNRGSILVVTLALTAVLGTTLASYLILTAGQQQSISRSQRWNSALDLAEAGVEEGLAQMNASPDDFSNNGWTVSSNKYGPQIRSFNGGTYGVVLLTNPSPTVYSTGNVTAPILGTVIKRTVRVTTQKLSYFNVGLGAVGNIDMNGNGMVTDSYNSHNTNLSTLGQYDPNKTSTNGDVASVGGIVNIGNHTIDGNLYLGPTASYTSGTNQVEGTIDKNYNVNFPDVVLPNGASSWTAAPLQGTNSNQTNWITTTGGKYTVNNNYPIVVAAGVSNVTINVTVENWSPGTINLLGGTTNPAYLTAYISPPTSGGSISIAGNATGGAGGATPLNFILFGMPNLSTITFSGTSQFVGAIYAPDASLTLNGGGNSNNLMGSAIVQKVTLNGHYDFHYDESLSSLAPAKRWVVNSWQEL
jgi:Tfp pilus assembly protein PilX